MAVDPRAEFDPKEIARASFPTAFRGYDQDAVRRYLSRLATAVDRAQQFGLLGTDEAGYHAGERENELELEISDLRLRNDELAELLRSQPVAEPAAPAPLVSRDLDESELIELLGQETARVLEQARSAGADIVHRAEAEAEAVKEQAVLDAGMSLDEANASLASARAEVEDTRAALASQVERSQARTKAEVAQTRELARAKADQIILEAARRAEEDLKAAERRAAETVAAAEQVRGEVLGDLVRRRRVYQEQLERMTSARDRLGQALSEAREQLEVVAADIDLAGPMAAELDVTDRVGEQLSGDGDAVAELVSQLQTARSSFAAEGSNGTDHAGFIESLLRSDSSSVRTDPTLRLGAIPSDVGPQGGYDLDHDLDLDLGPDHHHDGNSPNSNGFDDDFDFGAHDDSRDSEIVDCLGDGDTLSDIAGLGPEFDHDDGEDVNEAPTIDFQAVTADSVGLAEVDDRDTVDVLMGSGIEVGYDLEAAFGAVDSGPNGDSADPDGRRRQGQEQGRPADEVATRGRTERELEFNAAPVLGARSRNRSEARGDLPRNTPYGGELPLVFEGRDVALTRAMPGFRRRLKRAVNDDQSLVLDRLRGGRGGISGDELPDYDEQLSGYVRALEPSMYDVVKAGSEQLDHHEVRQESIERLCHELARHVVDCLRRPTMAAIEASTNDDRELILDPVRSIYRDFRNSVLPDLIDDALHEAFASGLFAAIDPSEHVLWLTDPRLDPDPICEENSAAPPLLRGTTFPSGHIRPLSMPGCRCLAMPVG